MVQNVSCNNRHKDSRKSSVCFVGNNSDFSFTAFQTLLAQHGNISQVILAGYAPATKPHQPLPVSLASETNTAPTTIQTLAIQQQIPVRYTSNDIQAFARWDNFPQHSPPDFLFVACFPFRLPTALRQWPTGLAVNLHPSLLPTYRGPDPLFWQLRHGKTQTGFSLHLLTKALDAGPLLFQQAVRFPPGASRKELDTLLAQQGAEAFCARLSTSALSACALNATEQNPQLASYEPLPQAHDYVLDTNWSAQRAYNFIRGTHTPLNGYPILLDGQHAHVEAALNVDPHGILGQQFARRDFVPRNDEILIQFSPGVLHAKPV